jgi:hypothetical protein
MANNHPGFADFAQSEVVSGSAAQSGTGSAGDPTTEPGNNSASLFGMAIPQTTGAPGSTGASGASDPTNEPGQLNEGISGLGPSDTANTGAPGTPGASNSEGGPDSVKYTLPGSYLSGTYVQDTVADSVSGPGDWTQAIDGSYGGGGPSLPGVSGNQPTSTGAGMGRVMRGGRSAG